MANLPEDASAFPAVYQIETTDPVVGGVPDPETGAGMSNIPHLQLARRTSWLRAAILALNLDKVADTATRVAMTVAERTKLAGIATAATRNAPDASLRDRATHTGTQAISSILNLQSQLDAKAAAAALTALQNIAFTTTNSPRQLTNPGHMQLGAGGLVIQWGAAPLRAAPTAVAFPRRFPTACFGVLISDYAGEALATRAHRVTVLSDTITVGGFTAFGAAVNETGELIDTGVFWIALGD